MGSGPLKGVRVIEMAGIGPAPMAITLLSDLGAEVVRVDRKSASAINPMANSPYELDGRGRRSIHLDLKTEKGVAALLRMIEQADILIEGFRPGVMERLGVGPDIALARNRRLVFGRMTGWGQDGPYAQMAGHDYNYVAISGAAYAIGPAERPVPPLNFLGDYAGALVMVAGVLAGLNHARATGQGQVIDTAMCEAASYISTVFHAMRQLGYYREERASNELDGGAPYYSAYRCADGEWVSIAAIEPQFFAELIEKLGLPERFIRLQRDAASHPELREALERTFATKTRSEWCGILEGSDVCFAPILRFSEAPDHPQFKARGHFQSIDGVVQPGPVPRFSATPGAIQCGPPKTGEHTRDVLRDWGWTEAEMSDLLSLGGT